MKISVVILSLCLIISTSNCNLSEQLTRNFYTAAVFEHVLLGNTTFDSPREIIHMNLDMYKRAAQVAASKGADIIVFPEYGIFPPVNRNDLKPYLEEAPDPRKEYSNPCNQRKEFASKPILYTLSCMAKEHKMVVVADTGDIQPCTPDNSTKCPEDGVYHFNTVVAFGRNGSLISKYHKVHLYLETGMDLPREPQNSIFDTDFGSFAMFICFDSMFEDIVKAAKKVDNVILSTMWIDTMPLMNAVQYWQAWALGNEVNFLVANIQNPDDGAVGSGMFSGHTGALKYTYNPDGLNKLVVSQVPKSKHFARQLPNLESSITVITANGTEKYNESQDGEDVPYKCDCDMLGGTKDMYKDYHCFRQNLVNYTLVKLTKNSDAIHSCNNGMCCTLNYSANSMNEVFYLGVYNGTHNINMLDRYFFCDENCLVVRCDDFKGSECSNFPMRSNTVFNWLEINANFTTPYVYPSVVNSAMRLAPTTEWYHYMNKEDNNIVVKLKFESNLETSLIVAGLKGRCYNRDPPYVR